MPPRLDPESPLACALDAGRDRFNIAFLQARYVRPQLNAEAFSDHLCTVVAPVVESVAAASPQAVPAVVDVLYDVSLELVGARLVGPTSLHPLIAEGWKRLLPRVIPHLVAQPRPLVAGVTNALHYLSTTPRARASWWLDEMCAMEFPAVEDLWTAGQVMAWRAGLAHFRAGALEACAHLSQAMGRRVLGLPEEGPTPLPVLLRRLASDPWMRPRLADRPSAPARELQVVGRVGNFHGFGGMFRRPPEVTAIGDRFYVCDPPNAWLLSADIYGATLLPTALPGADAPRSESGAASPSPQE